MGKAMTAHATSAELAELAGGGGLRRWRPQKGETDNTGVQRVAGRLAMRHRTLAGEGCRG